MFISLHCIKLTMQFETKFVNQIDEVFSHHQRYLLSNVCASLRTFRIKTRALHDPAPFQILKIFLSELVFKPSIHKDD